MATGTNTVILHVKCRDLHQVIRGLTRGQNYGLQKILPKFRLKLYDAYREMEEYDAKRIQAAFPDKSAKTLHTNKILLLNQIVRYLLDTTPHNGMRDLTNMIAEAKLLRKKSHTAVAMDRITSAIKLARDLDAMPELLDALKLRRRLLDSLGVKQKKDEDYAALEEYALKGIEETYRIETLYSKAVTVRMLPFEDQLPQIEETEKSKLEMPYPSLVRNQILFHKVGYFICRRKNNIDGAVYETKVISGLLEASSLLLADEEIRESYFIDLKFLSVAYAEKKDLQQAEYYLGKLIRLAKKWDEGKDSNPSLYASIVYVEIWLKIVAKDWKSARQMTQKVYKEVVQEGHLDGEASRPSVLRIGALSAYLNKDYGSARNFLRELKKCLVAGNSKYNVHLWAVWTGLVYMLSYLDEEDPYLRTAYNDIAKWFATLGIRGRYETLILNFIKKANEEVNPKATTSSLYELKSELEAIFVEPQMARYKAIFPILEWIEAKLSGTDLRSMDLI